VICIDSSVALKLILDEEDSEAARNLLTSYFQQQRDVIAPTLLNYEIANVLRKQCAFRGMSQEIADRNLRIFLQLPISVVSDDSLHETALRLANGLDLPGSYDAHYIALAQRMGCDLWTADKRLLNALRGRLPFVRNLATFTDDSIQSAT
jgi:predicted nucleic acid-binding protein